MNPPVVTVADFQAVWFLAGYKEERLSGHPQ